ncbi:PDxFFG protein [Mycoplasma zalophidermidis]|uniref:PDxFFG protein n=1 Tax=Mycoplasma zalophidermidis TaxID=398174 RepID=UPI001C1107C1|nr:PDxFFG protein [Mycoplasma zalophidermidis]MBU4689985.1 PDxFFG protein [Mycoplasma zalophidermidis]
MKEKKNKSKKPFNWRTLVWPKYAISLGIIVFASAATIGIMKYNSTKPVLEKGTEAKELKNEFVDPSVGAVLSFVNTDKDKTIGEFDPNKGPDGLVKYKDKWVDYNDFLKIYYNENHTMPFLNIRYGMFDFYNEYIEAVSAKDFYEFTQWFMKNVSWGPEIITLKEFSIVKGVELNGNNITLGSHSNKDKEYTTIKFFPDAFFGSIPLHSELGGSGNATDSLLYKINKKLLSGSELTKFLESIAQYNSLTNISDETLKTQSFRTINDKRGLLNKSVFAISGDLPAIIKDNSFSDIEKSRLNIQSNYISVVFADNEKEAQEKFAKLAQKYQNNDKNGVLKNINNFKFVKKTIVDTVYTSNIDAKEFGAEDEYLKIIFNDGASFVLFDSIENVQYQQGDHFASAENVESITHGLERGQREYSNLESDIQTLFSNKFANNIYFNNLNKDRFVQLVEDLDSIKDLRKQITIANKVIIEKNKDYDEIINKFNEHKVNSQKQLEDLNNKIASNKDKITKLSAEINSSTDEVIKKQKNFEIFKIEKENKSLELNKYELEQLVNFAVEKILEYKKMIPSDQELENANKKIKDLTEKITKLDEPKINQELIKILRRAKIAPEHLESLIGLYKLANVVKTSKFNTPVTEFSNIKQKADYVKELRDFISQNRPLFKFYNEILGGNNFAKLEPESNDYVYYSNDLGFLPTQLIALDELSQISNLNQINWREYVNIDGFLRSQSDTQTKQFYVYAPELKTVKNDYNEPKETLESSLAKDNQEFNTIKDSFIKNKELVKKSDSINNKVNAKGFDKFVAEFKKAIQELTDLGNNYKLDVDQYVKVMTLKSLVEYEDEKTKEKILYNEIVKLITEDNDLVGSLESFKSVMADIDVTRKQIQTNIETYKIKVAKILSNIISSYSQMVKISKEYKSDFDSYTKSQLQLYDKQLSVLLSKLSSVDLSNSEISKLMNELVATAFESIDIFNKNLANNESTTSKILVEAKNALDYVKSYESKIYSTTADRGIFDEMITDYFSLVSSPIFRKYNLDGTTNNSHRKYIAVLFNPLIAYQKSNFELNYAKAQDYKTKVTKLQSEINNLPTQDEKNKKQKELVLLQNNQLYYEYLAENNKFEDGQVYNTLNKISVLKQAWTFTDFENNDNFIFSFSKDSSPLKDVYTKAQVDRFNKSLQIYTETKTKLFANNDEFIQKPIEFLQKLLTNANSFNIADEKYETTFEKAVSVAKQIWELDQKNKKWHEPLLTGEGNEINSTNPLIVASTKIELIDKLTNLGIIKNDTNVDQFVQKYIHRMQLNSVQKQGTKLILTLKEKQLVKNDKYDNYMSTKYLKFNIDANTSDNVGDSKLEQVKELFDVLGYKAVVQPSIIKEEGSKLIVDENGQTISVPTYNVYVEAYDNFTNTLLNKIPWAGEWLEGEHLVKKLNADGVIEYKVEKGKYLGFTPDSRVGLWALLAMNNTEYKGISIDFLKFVAAHEYGHHITLNSAQDLGDKGEKPIYGSALLPGATPNIQNYYSRKALDLYLKARTHLKLNSSPLLNQPNVVSENNEGEYLLYNQPKKVNGKVITDKSTVENPEDVWGHKIGHEDLKQAMENKKRRFLQTYEGLVEATKLRRQANGIDTPEDKKWLEVFDLWLMNTLDQNSGTLNPTKFSDNQFPVKYMVKDADGKWRFKKASLDMLKGVIKDGKGNFIEFEDVNGVALPKIVEGERNAEGKFKKITKVLVYNVDGTPIVNVPLNIDFEDPRSSYYQVDAEGNNVTIKFVNDKIQEAIDTIRSLIVEEFVINGWDFATTDTSTKPKTSIAYPSYAEIFPSIDPNYNKAMLLPYIDHLKSRDKSKGYIHDNYEIAKFYDVNGDVLFDPSNPSKDPNFKESFQEVYYLNAFDGVKKEEQNLNNLLVAMYLGNGSTLELVSAGGKQSLWLSESEQYLPNVKLPEAISWGFLEEELDLSTLKELHQKPILNWFKPYISQLVGNKANQHSYLMVKADGSIVNNNPKYESFPAFWEMKSLKINESILSQDVEKSLFGSYYVVKAGKKEYGYNITFNDYKQFMKFASVDTTKAKLDPDNRVVNWDLEYVKERFNLKIFSSNLTKSLASARTLSSEEKARLTALINSNDEQLLANEVMNRFINSKLALFVKELTLGEIDSKINENSQNELTYGWIFDKDLGYGLWKSDDVVVGKQNPDRANWEISVKELFNTFKEFADQNGVDLNQFTMFDELILDNKTQMYSTQLLYNFRLGKFSLKDILLAFVKGITKKAKPSDDVVSYFKTKTERKFNEFFSDYTYSFAEVINRDNLQITYSPSNSQFRNLPSFISGVNESNTGLEYVIDGQPTAKWNKALIEMNSSNQHSIISTITNYETRKDAEGKLRADKLGMEFIPSDMAKKTSFSNDSTRQSTYFGKFKSINNGWFKDRWYRDVLNFRIYDDEGNPIADDTISITDLEGKKVTNRAKAYWQYYIQSQGVGLRNLSNIWRHTDKDAIAMFGYLNSEDAKKANYLVFKDLVTSEIKTLKINKNHSSNMFYYTTQHVNNETNPASRHWLKDEVYDYTDSNGHHKGKGFVAWVSDYGIMSNYSNKLLTPNHEYEIYFSDNELGNKTLEIDLGSNQSISENGKTFSQAPTAVYIKDINGKNTPVFKVGVQFNGTK